MVGADGRRHVVADEIVATAAEAFDCLTSIAHTALHTAADGTVTEASIVSE